MTEEADNLAKLTIKAAKKGDSAAIKALVSHIPTLLEARDTDGSTPLHCAVWRGHSDAVRLLISLGADVNAKSLNDHYGDTPLHAAAHGNQREIADILLAAGARVDSVNPAGRTPLDETEIHKATAVAKLLRERRGL